MRKLLFFISFAMGLYAGTLSGSGSSLDVSNTFSQKSASIGVRLGSSSIGNETYTIAGLSANYFIIDDLSIGFGYEKWFSGNPDISKITIESSYYFPIDEEIRPYAGVFYRRILIGDTSDIKSHGYRVGIAFVQKNLLLSAGIVQEKYDATRGILDGTETYTELTIGFMF